MPFECDRFSCDHSQYPFIFAVLPTSALQLSQGGDGLHSGGGGTIVQYATQSQDGQFFVPGKWPAFMCSNPFNHPSIHPILFVCHLNTSCVSLVYFTHCHCRPTPTFPYCFPLNYLKNSQRNQINFVSALKIDVEFHANPFMSCRSFCAFHPINFISSNSVYTFVFASR